MTTTENRPIAELTKEQRAEITELLKTFSMKEIAAKYRVSLTGLYEALSEPKKRERTRKVLRVELGKKKTNVIVNEATKRNVSPEVLAAKLLICIVDGNLFNAVLDDGKSNTDK